ncbi:hypothetical protein MHBO_000980 [Bonamia ostreae]|uniref:DNA helicase n=1 Tax=Bonamia ostreae TaxID=126728 RepID=A0ABV2AHG0_9EUKA
MDEVEENGETEIFERFDRLLNDKPFFEEQINGQKIRKKNQFFTLDFMRKYIEYAKTQSHPVLSKEATEKICAAYCLIRNREENTTLPITARYVETMIRFATAHAKLRLSQIVEEIDVEKSLEILLYSLGGEAALSANEENEMSDKENDVQSTQIEPVDPVSKKSKSALKKAPMRRKLSHKKDEKKSKKLKKRQKVESDEEKENKPSERIDETRKKIVMTVISRLTRRSGLDITVSEVMNIVNKQTERKFEKKEFDEIIRSLEESNKIMVADNIIHRI